MYAFLMYVMLLMTIMAILLGQYAYGLTPSVDGQQTDSVQGPPTAVIVVGFATLIIGIWLIGVDRKLQKLAEETRGAKIVPDLVDYPLDRKLPAWICWNLIEMLLLFAAIFTVCYLRPNLIFYIFLALAGLQLFIHLWFDHRPLGQIRTLPQYREDMKYQARKDLSIVIVMLTVLLVVMFDFVELATDSKSFVYAFVVLAICLMIGMYWYFKMPTSSYMQYSGVVSSILTVGISLLLLPFPG